MKLFTDNSCNINYVKILTVSEFCNVKIDLIKTFDIDKPGNSVIFELNNGSSLFSSNAVCRYLWSSSEHLLCDNLESWLEWECVVLQPSISTALKAVKDDSLLSDFKNNLCYLNAVLSQQSYLSCKDSPDLADLIVWANLYPLYKASLLPNIANLPNLQKWLTILKEDKGLEKAFSRIAGDAKSDLKKNLVLNSVSFSKFFMPVVVPDYKRSSEMEQTVSEVSKDAEVSVEDMVKAYNCWIVGKSAMSSVKEKKVPVLPKKGEKNILITSALPYVNNIPHLGNIIGSVLSADVFARYCRARGYNTLYICGTDEYGTATETKAIASNMTPKEICDKYNKLHSDIYNWFNISFDYFGRTTTEKQTLIAQDMFNKLHAQNHILIDSVEQLYCESCQRFLADRFVEGICPLCAYEDARGDQCDKCGKLINAAELKNPQCKLCKKTPHLRTSKHLFLDLPNLEKPLKEYLDKVTTAESKWSNTAKVIAYSWLKEGLKPRCITRDLKWGTPVPLEGFTDKVFYVWYDAPIGYLSITANYTDEWEKWWKQPDIVQLYQFMAKDNVPFHGIIFPACQLGSKDNYTKINHLCATEYLNYEDVKFSKSRGIGVFGDDAKDTGIPSDMWRFYLLYIRPEAQDTYFSWSDLMLKINSELLNNLGNFINRALTFISNNFGGVIPEMNHGDNEKQLIAQVDRELKQYVQCMEKTRLRDAIKYMLNISRFGNFYIQSNKPWELVKGSEAEKTLAGTVLGLSANICCLLCTLMEPYMPDTCASLKLQLNTEAIHHVLIDNFVCLLPSGFKIGKPAPLFKKIDQDLINELKKKYAGKQVEEKQSSPPKESKAVTQHLPNGVVDLQALESSVAVQGEKVRSLKAEKASKSEIDKEVAVLLQLKRELSIAKGENPDVIQTKSKNKKKR